MTRYILLQQTNEDAWHEVGSVNARSADAALAKECGGDNDDGHVFIAVPARYWNPRLVTVTTAKPIVKITPA